MLSDWKNDQLRSPSNKWLPAWNFFKCRFFKPVVTKSPHMNFFIRGLFFLNNFPFQLLASEKGDNPINIFRDNPFFFYQSNFFRISWQSVKIRAKFRKKRLQSLQSSVRIEKTDEKGQKHRSAEYACRAAAAFFFFFQMRSGIRTKKEFRIAADCRRQDRVAIFWTLGHWPTKGMRIQTFLANNVVQS